MIKQDRQILSALNSFKLLLLSEKVSNGTIRSYLSDTRHFIAWLNLYQKSNRQITSSLIGSIALVRSKTINHYLEYLVENHVPSKTINRRLSSLRKFGGFCVSQGWLADNYFSYLKNITSNQPASEDIYFLNEYRQKLIAENNTSQTIKNYLSDIRHFINWHACHPDQPRRV